MKAVAGKPELRVLRQTVSVRWGIDLSRITSANRVIRTVVPLFPYSRSAAMLCLGSFLMQVFSRARGASSRRTSPSSRPMPFAGAIRA